MLLSIIKGNRDNFLFAEFPSNELDTFQRKKRFKKMVLLSTVQLDFLEGM